VAVAGRWGRWGRWAVGPVARGGSGGSAHGTGAPARLLCQQRPAKILLLGVASLVLCSLGQLPHCTGYAGTHVSKHCTDMPQDWPWGWGAAPEALAGIAYLLSRTPDSRYKVGLIYTTNNKQQTAGDKKPLTHRTFARLQRESRMRLYALLRCPSLCPWHRRPMPYPMSLFIVRDIVAVAVY
jgi:hypothetical protein